MGSRQDTTGVGSHQDVAAVGSRQDAAAVGSRQDTTCLSAGFKCNYRNHLGKGLKEFTPILPSRFLSLTFPLKQDTVLLITDW